MGSTYHQSGRCRSDHRTFWNRKIHIFKMCGQTGKPETGTITIDGETQDLAHIHGKDLTELRKKTLAGFSEFQSFFKEDSTSECNGGADRGKEDEKRGSRKDCERAA